jgi:OmcA/MtrC family decaheme c-type cytochrome
VFESKSPLPTIGATFACPSDTRAGVADGLGGANPNQFRKTVMKFSSARTMARSRVPLIALLALAATIGIAGCENDGGPAGPDGGDSGQTGPTGPTGPVVANVGTGSTLTAQQIADIGTLVAQIDSAAITGNKPVIEITVRTDKGGAVLGLAATTLRLGVAKLVPAANGLPSRWQSYINRNGTPSIQAPALTAAVQANTESGVAAGWQELGEGRYRYTGATDLANVTTPIAVSYEPALTHRISIALDLADSARPLAPDNPFIDFVPNGGAADSKLIVSTAACASCHVRFGEHGGPRRDAEYCAVCHNPATIDPDSGESVDFAYMAHSIHRGEARSTPYVVYGRNGDRFDTGEVTYPQPLSFCETCHTQSAATPQGDDWMANPTAAACGGCHDAGLNKTGPSATTGLYTYTYTHSSTTLPPGYTADDGTCGDCHRSGGVAGSVLAVHQRDPARKAIDNGSLFTYKVLQIEQAAAGSAPKVTFQILDANGAPVNVKAITTGRLRLDFAWSTPDIHNVADKDGDAYAADRGEAIVIDLIANMASVVDNGNGTFSYTLATPLPAGFADATLGTGLMVVLEGRRAMPDGSNAYPDSAFAFAGTPREKLVDQAKCETCHRKVALHGGSRAGDPMICNVCHNSSVGGTWDGNNGPEVYGPLALGAFIHGLHAGKVAPVGAVTYPQSLARCEGCHVDGKAYTARSTALPITVDAGAAELAWKDDTADSATAGTCKACHTSADAQTHMLSQGGSFGVAKALVPSSAAEGCTVCHGAGRSFDTVAMHCATLPFGQCSE